MATASYEPLVISINGGKDFEPVSEGVHSAVLGDIVDKGIVPTPWGDKHKIMFVWLTDEADEGGGTKYVFQTFGASLHEKSTLRKAVKAIRQGKDIEGSDFNVRSLVGSQVQLVIQHNEGNNGKVYANVSSILKPKGATVDLPAGFKFEKKEKGSFSQGIQAATPGLSGTSAARAILAPAKPIDDSGVPF